MITYIGTQEDAYWVEEVASKKKLQVQYVPASLHIQSQINAILERPCTYMIFDLIQYDDEAELITEYICKIRNANHAKVIILAGANFLPEARIIQALYAAGITGFIFAWTAGEQKEELEQCMNGFMDANIHDLFQKAQQPEKTAHPEEERSIDSGRKKYIGVAGALHRMGTTTQAIQMIKYLQLHGKSACYLEMNETGYCKSLEEWFQVEEKDAYLGRITVFGVDLFYKSSMLAEVLKEKYDYFIYDYGTYSDTSFNRTSYMEKDIKVMVVGSGAAEMAATGSILQSEFYKNIEYVYNLVPEGEQKEILALMEEKEEQTHFSGYAPDPFFLASTTVYQKLFDFQGRPNKKEKGGWWKRKKKRGRR